MHVTGKPMIVDGMCVAHLGGEVQPAPIAPQHVDYSQALERVVKALRAEPGEHRLARVAWLGLVLQVGDCPAAPAQHIDERVPFRVILRQHFEHFHRGHHHLRYVV